MPKTLVSSLFDRLKKRKLVQWLVVYAAGAWVVLQFTDLIGRQFQWPLVVQQSFTIALAFGFFIAAVVAWYHGERGQQRVQHSEFLLIGVIVLAGGVTISARYARNSGSDADVIGALADFLAPDPNKVLVIPFRVPDAVPSLEYLHEGMMDLVYSRLSGLGGLRAVNPRTTMAQLRSPLLEAQDEPETGQALRIADALGAGFLILGEVTGSPDLLSLSASLLEVPGGQVVGSATVSGPQDSLTVMVNQLAIAALQARAGEDEYAITASLPAVQSYLEGRRLLRGGNAVDAVRSFDTALEVDSTLTAAAFGLWRAGMQTGGLQTDAMFRGARVVEQRRDRLSPGHLAYLTAVRNRTATEVDDLELKIAAAEADPESAELWVLLGQKWLETGRLMAVPDWAARSREALARARILDPEYAGAYHQSLRLLFASRDTVGMRQLWERYSEFDSDGELYSFFQWRVAVALEDEEAITALRRGFGDFPRNSVNWMAYTSIFDGIPLDDAEAASTALAARAATDQERFLVQSTTVVSHAARGRVSMMPTTVPTFPEFIFLMEDYDAFKREIQATVEALGDVPDSWCDKGRIRTVRGDTTGLRSLAQRLDSLADTRIPGRRARVCSALLRAYVETAHGGLARPALERADSMVRTGTEHMEDNYMLARMFETRGEPGRALAAIRRFPYAWGNTLALHKPAYLREEGRYAAQVGDTAAAIEAYSHYLTLRTDPDPELQAEVDRVRQALLALGGEPPGG